MNYNWNWNILFETNPSGEGSYLMMLIGGLGWTLTTAVSASCIAMLVGTVVGIARTRSSKLSGALARLYVEIFRNIPILVQLFLWYFVLPELLPQETGTWLKQLSNVSLYTAILGLGLYMAARVAEQVRSGIEAVPIGQKMASSSLGMTEQQSLRYVVLPRAFRIIIPTLTTDAMNAVKNSSVALTIGVAELTSRTYAVQEFTFQTFEVFTAATLVYVAVNTCVVIGMRRLEKKLAMPGFMQAN